MDEKTAHALNAINLAFYRESAEEFSATRNAPWPGWDRIDEVLARRERGRLRVLDVGCGNGRFGAFLAARGLGPDRYTGIDASDPLLEDARRRLEAAAAAADRPIELELRRVDLAAPCLEAALPVERFGLVAVLGVLHHLPGLARRRALIGALPARLEPGGLLVLAFWRFAAFERFRRRLLPWQEFNRTAAEAIDVARLEPGDHLIRWGVEPGRQRYCHFASDAEIAGLIDPLDLEPVCSYTADGRCGDVNQYALLRAAGA